MAEAWVTLALIAPLAVGLGWAIWSLVDRARPDRRLPAMLHRARVDQTYGTAGDHYRITHGFRGQGEAITVAELLEDAIERGEGIRLNWPTDDLYSSPIRPDEQGQFPTEVLPRVEDTGLNEE